MVGSQLVLLGSLRGKRTLYFTYESHDCLKSFTLIITVKTFTKLNLRHSNRLEIKILKISRRGSSFPDNAELDHFTLLFCRGR